MKFFIPKNVKVKRYDTSWNFKDGFNGSDGLVEWITTEIDVTYEVEDLRPMDWENLNIPSFRQLHFKLPSICKPWSYIEVDKKWVIIS